MSGPTRVASVPQWSVLGRVRVPRKGGRFGFTEEYYDQPRHFVDFIKTWEAPGRNTARRTTGWIWSHSARSGHDGCRELRLRELAAQSSVAHRLFHSEQLHRVRRLARLEHGMVAGEASRWRCQTMDTPCGTWMQVLATTSTTQVFRHWAWRRSMQSDDMGNADKATSRC